MHKAKILYTEFVTHNVRSLIVEKPDGYEFSPGQATLVAVNKPDWQDIKRPFTFTSQPEDPVLQFTIKEYPSHDGVSERIHELKPGAELLLDDPWGTINYKGPGVFIAGGAGITPFIAILRHLHRKKDIAGNHLIFSNKRARDIILEKEFNEIFANNPHDLIYTLTQEQKKPYLNQRIDKDFLQEYITDFSQNFYVCGPKPFNKDIIAALEELGAKVDSIVFEK